jgi:hypothetical protein
MQAFALLLVVSVFPGLVCGNEQEEQLSVLAGRVFASLSAGENVLEGWRVKKDLQ